MEEAISELNKALKINPQLFRAHFNIAGAYLKLK